MSKATGVEVPIRTSVVLAVVYLWEFKTTILQQVIIVEVLMSEEHLLL